MVPSGCPSSHGDQPAALLPGKGGRKRTTPLIGSENICTLEYIFSLYNLKLLAV